MRRNKYSPVIWDWNGTLLDDLDWCIRVTNSMLEQRALPALGSAADYHAVFCFPVVDYYKKLGFDFAAEPFEALAEEYVALYMADETGGCALHAGAEAVLAEIQRRGMRQVILSASERQKLMRQVESLGAARYFDELLGIENIYAGGKTQLALEYAAREKPERVLFVGDTAHDYEVARAIGADCVLIARGHESESALRALGAPVLGDIADVLDYI